MSDISSVLDGTLVQRALSGKTASSDTAKGDLKQKSKLNIDVTLRDKDGNNDERDRILDDVDDAESGDAVDHYENDDLRRADLDDSRNTSRSDDDFSGMIVVCLYVLKTGGGCVLTMTTVLLLS